MNGYATARELIDSLRGVLALVPGGQVRVEDEQLLQGDAMDRLAYNAVFGTEEVMSAARWIIWESAQQLGVVPSSIQSLYEARGRGEVDHFTVPAMNLRGMAYDTARAALRAAVRLQVGAFIFEIARSEMGYTSQRPEEYSTVLLAAALREGFRGPLFIQGDHFQVNRKRWEQDPTAEIEGVKKLAKEAVAAGFFNIDIDTSTLVDLSQPTVDEQQRNNFANAAELTAYIRSVEPEGITISVGGEIGEVGGKNSTPDEFHAYMKGYLRDLRKRDSQLKGISKISVQTGTSHGGVVLPDGRIADVALDFNVLRDLSRIAREQYGLGGAVQHGASTLPDEAFHKFVEAGCCEVHLATAFQNLLLDSKNFPADLRSEMYDYLHREMASEKKPNQSEDQFIYKTRKNVFGPFKQQLWDLPAEVRAPLNSQQEDKFAFYYQQLDVINTRDLVDQWVKPVKVSKARPQGLEEVARS